MTDENESLIQEVNERLRHERQLALVKRYGPWAAGAALALFLGLGGWLWYQDASTNAARAQSERFIAAQEIAREGDAAVAAEQFATLSQEGPRSYRVMAMMERAGVLERQGDLDAALAGFDAAAEAARDPILRDTARIRAAYIVADTQDFAALRARLDPIIAEGGGISFLARELLGVEAWEAGEDELARQTFDGLNLAFDTPESVRQRINLALAVLGPGDDAPTVQEAPVPTEESGDAQ